MIKWIYEGRFLENNETLFYLSTLVIVLIIVITFILVWKELKKYHENK